MKDLQDKADRMHNFLQKEVGSEPNEIIERIEHLSILISQSGQLLSKCKYLQDTVIHGSIMNAIKDGYTEKLTPSALNKFVGALAKEENYLVKQFDEINSAAGKQLSGLITILSYRKTEFSFLNYTK